MKPSKTRPKPVPLKTAAGKAQKNSALYREVQITLPPAPWDTPRQATGGRSSTRTGRKVG
jgi:hypothetical protein